MPPLPHLRPLAFGLLSLFALGVQASTLPTIAVPPPESRITQVKVYPGSATVERMARVVAGSKTLTFTCLPAGLDVQSLQVSADASVRVGETAVLTEPRAQSAACATSVLDGRIRELEDQKAALQSETDALDLVTGYLKGISTNGGGSDATPALRAAPDAKSVTAMADALRRTGQDSLQKQHLLKRRQAELDKQLAPMLAERARSQGNGGNVVSVTVTLATARDADVRLSYQVNGPGWTPAYRAMLDTGTRKLRMERQALVAQATGEDWRGVKLTLSTGQPRRETTGRLPMPWRIGIVEPQPERRAYGGAPMPASAPAPAMAAEMAKRQEPLFDVSVFNNSFATEFSVPNAIDVPSSGQRVSMALGQTEDTVKLAVRTSPQVDASAFLIADMAPPEGVWPAGPLQLYRDGAFVGNGQWTPPGDARVTLSFGRDELVRVQAEPERDNRGETGFVGVRAERKLQRGYVVENRHRTPIAVQVLEAAPVSVDDKVRVAAVFAPQPAEREWNKQPGMALWSFELAAGQSARVAADYTISYPKDAQISSR
ncbi:DUF4139 domain-containing protein [Variovorax sp. J22G21]|uniref:DUF4139 domain-containing protein n=1 Tax=Variovorax fucosicus TaxID=3053517 RepID=UPI002577AC76|nr:MULTISPECIES: DUF4139 domain-containing protein [unclassified Variovorax]MDM0039876.1 DUF4139 domain-containing protein [Variovorax sp. J22R193]MDM0064575.1 DUF4139 domain-containing protein [Variovorax sp. J22G21]